MLPEGNRAVAGKYKGKNILSKMTEYRFLSVYAEGMLQTCMGELPGKESGINRGKKENNREWLVTTDQFLQWCAEVSHLLYFLK